MINSQLRKTKNSSLKHKINNKKVRSNSPKALSYYKYNLIYLVTFFKNAFFAVNRKF